MIAMRMYTRTEESDALNVATSLFWMNKDKMLGKNTRPKVSTKPTRIEAIKAPFTEPIPPITMTTSASISTGSPMPTSTEYKVLTNEPAKPAKAAPKAKTRE